MANVFVRQNPLYGDDDKTTGAKPNTAVTGGTQMKTGGTGTTNTQTVVQPVATPDAKLNIGNVQQTTGNGVQITPKTENVTSQPTSNAGNTSSAPTIAPLAEQEKEDFFNSVNNTNAYKAKNQAKNEDLINRVSLHQNAYDEYVQRVKENNARIQGIDKKWDDDVDHITNLSNEDVYNIYLTPKEKKKYNSLKGKQRDDFIQDTKLAILDKYCEKNSPAFEFEEDIYPYEDWSKQNPMNDADPSSIDKRAEEIKAQLDAMDEQKRAEEEEARKPKSWQDLRDQMFGDERDYLVDAKRRTLINAVGDSLRHIGNLYFTNKNAVPQQFGSNPAVESMEGYKKDRKERDAMSYQMWNQMQKEEIARQEQVRKAAMDQFNMMCKDRDFNLKVEDFKLKVNADARDEARLKVYLQKELQQIKNLVAQGEYTEARVRYQNIINEWTPKEKAASVNQKNAAASASRAAAELSKARKSVARAQRKKIEKETSNIGKKSSGGRGKIYPISDGRLVEVKGVSGACDTDLGDAYIDWLETDGQEYLDDDGGIKRGMSKKAEAAFRKTKAYDAVILRYAGQSGSFNLDN